MTEQVLRAPNGERLVLFGDPPLYVDPTAEPGGDGSYARPFRTIREALEADPLCRE